MRVTNEKGMEWAQVVSELSTDKSRRCGCVIVRDDAILASGYNRFPLGVLDIPARHQRPAKYIYTEHAERWAMYQAARDGVSLKGATAYVNWFPCADCARGLVIVEIARLVCFEPDWTESRYGFTQAADILMEGGVAVEYVGQKVEKAQ